MYNLFANNDNEPWNLGTYRTTDGQVALVLKGMHGDIIIYFKDAGEVKLFARQAIARMEQLEESNG